VRSLNFIKDCNWSEESIWLKSCYY
jgi:hypothetical protein